MSATQTYLVDMPLEAPLSDCTNAVGNAENINRARAKGAKPNKKRSQAQEKLTQLLKQQAESQDWHTTVSRRPAPLSFPSPSQVASPTALSPYGSPSRDVSTSVGASPIRCHNPYTPLVAKHVDMSAEESFYASYSETFTCSADISAISDASDVSVDQLLCDAHEASRRRCNTLPLAATQQPQPQQPQQTQQQRYSVASPVTPLRQMPVPRSQLNAVAAGTNASARYTAAASEVPSATNSANTSVTRVVRTVVGCSVDRASGRPIPRFAVNNGVN